MVSTSQINLEAKLRRLDWFWCRSTLLNNQKGERLKDQHRSSRLQLNFRTWTTENLYAEGDGPLTHLKTSSALLRHHGMVISCREKQSRSVNQHFLCNVSKPSHHWTSCRSYRAFWELQECFTLLMCVSMCHYRYQLIILQKTSDWYRYNIAISTPKYWLLYRIWKMPSCYSPHIKVDTMML